ncbi:MAG: TRAP transporter small permease [Thermincola sp.]|nr:TRAP transporter small permease [Thermincola sp.]
MENSSGAPQNLTTEGTLGKMDKLVHLLSVWFERIGMVGLVGIIIATLIDVIGAKLFTKPLAAGTEVVYFLQVIAIAGSLAATKIDGKYIKLEFVDSFPPRIRHILDFLVALLGLVLFILLVWKSYEYAQALKIAKEVTAASRIPVYPFVLWIALSCIPLCLVLLQEMLKSAKEVVNR